MTASAHTRQASARLEGDHRPHRTRRGRRRPSRVAPRPLHPSPARLEDLVDLLERTKVKVLTVGAGEYDLATATGRMSARVVGAVARHESEHKSERVQDCWSWRRRARSRRAATDRSATNPTASRSCPTRPTRTDTPPVHHRRREPAPRLRRDDGADRHRHSMVADRITEDADQPADLRSARAQGQGRRRGRLARHLGSAHMGGRAADAPCTRSA